MDTYPYLLAMRTARRRWLVSGSRDDLQAWVDAWRALAEAHTVAADSRRVAATRVRRPETEPPAEHAVARPSQGEAPA